MREIEEMSRAEIKKKMGKIKDKCKVYDGDGAASNFCLDYNGYFSLMKELLKREDNNEE